MTEEDIKQKIITPSIKKSGWKDSQINYEYAFTDGRFILKGKDVVRDKPKRADYLLSYKSNIPLAIIEAKSDKHSLGDGIQQGINYAEMLDLPFVYSSNGSGFLEHNMLTGEEREISLYDFPSPEVLWNRYKQDSNIDDEKERIINRVLLNNESIMSVSINEGLPSDGMLCNWILKYKENGYNIVERKRGRPTMPKVTKKKENETDKEKIKRLEEENLYLKAELEYSKKLRAVVQARKNQQQKKK